jgi:hypothetical protein
VRERPCSRVDEVWSASSEKKVNTDQAPRRRWTLPATHRCYTTRTPQQMAWYFTTAIHSYPQITNQITYRSAIGSKGEQCSSPPLREGMGSTSFKNNRLARRRERETAACREFVLPQGIFSDGSGDAKYSNDANCLCKILFPSILPVHLTFTTFQTEPRFDYVEIYGCEVPLSPRASC